MSEAETKLTSVEAGAAQHEEVLKRAVLEHDQKKRRQGFEMGRPDDHGNIRVSTIGMTGTQFEEYCLRANTEEKPRHSLRGRELPCIDDDNQVITSALSHSFFAHDSKDASIYENRDLYLSEWLHDLYHQICMVLRERETFSDAEKRGVLMESIVKPVPCLQSQMDLHRGVDCLLVFHDPDAFQEAQRKQFLADSDLQPSHLHAREARYWNPDCDTIVTMDISAYLGTKFGNAKRRSKGELRADIFASKTQSAVNHYIRQRLQGQGAQQLPERMETRGGQFYWNRMEVLAKRIVDVFEAKSGRMGTEKFPHLRNPEAEMRARVEAQQDETRRKAQPTTELRKQKRKEKKEGKQKGVEAREQAENRNESNLASMTPHERRIYEAKQAEKAALIERAKNRGKPKKKD